ncbi:lysylphosphatidylglycerol synthase domain-containing protein [Nocardioides sp. 503]|uniref:lysylphosphatidylglycerol synthase domain-containing protein n=1 Tax=Nocardioides sp. 503 TaxID=2508326 RepID=UPI00142F8EFF|nr:lysylphosphatidylglycerol synthase domain-containing protein [Nocardioides sp. 503]
MTDPAGRPLRRDALLWVLRVLFLLAVVAFAWLGLRGRFDELGAALARTWAPGAVAAFALVLSGLSATGLLWRRLLASVGAEMPVSPGMATFFVGQLGKYIPGSVWSIGAQAQLARRWAVPARATVTAGLLFLGYHLATAVLLGAGVLLLGELDPPWPVWVSAAALVVGVLGLLPPVVGQAARRVAGAPVRVGVGDTAAALSLMTLAWGCYSAALVLLAPGVPWDDLAAYGGAFAVAYAAGVVLVVAPAGLGAREGLFVLLLAPTTGVAEATALALLARVLHTLADGALAAGWWLAERRSDVREPDSARHSIGRSSSA